MTIGIHLEVTSRASAGDEGRDSFSSFVVLVRMYIVHYILVKVGMLSQTPHHPKLVEMLKLPCRYPTLRWLCSWEGNDRGRVVVAVEV